LLGKPFSDADSAPVALASVSDAGEPQLHFDVEATIEGVLLERYHSGLEPTFEMRLPLNYSRLPGWLKQLALGFRTGALYSIPPCGFPPGDPSFVVEWLRALARWAGRSAGRRFLSCKWPDDYRAAVTITHDVDTGWIFDHPDWIERFTDLEAAHGFHGAWYCVPTYANTKAAERGIECLLARGCEIGCHGYNHDAKWALMEGPALGRRLAAVRAFAERWRIRGFRSEWLWRPPHFLEAIAEVFDYDTSVPNVYSGFTRFTRNGCGACIPYRTHGDLVELPLTLPMDEERRREGLDVQKFWLRQIDRAEAIIERGGMVVLTLHPQPHQAANEESLAALEAALHWLGSQSDLWIARPDEIVDWVAGSHREEVV
jgi:peptidoglycan/xylan/chitin deacetylase (PgdA/CDA1 family)